MIRNRAKVIKRNRKKLIRYSLLAGNIAIVVVAVFLIIRNSGGNTGSYSALNTAAEKTVSNPLDTLSAMDIAANVALMTEFPEAGYIINEATSVVGQLSAATTSQEAVYKPQILSTDIKTKDDIKEHIVAENETLATLSTKYGVTSDSIRWSNHLVSSYLRTGTKLVIPPVNGIIHTVKNGDTAEALARTYNTSKEQIIRFNDAEISGLVVGERIVIPGGTIRAAASSYVPYYSRFAFGNTAIYGYNGYAAGYCTWHVANRRAAIGRPVPANLGNASTWDNFAPQGWNRTPKPGAAVVTNESGPGHVAFVENVLYNPDGSISGVVISEMNFRWVRYETRTITWDANRALNSGYKYIH